MPEPATFIIIEGGPAAPKGQDRARSIRSHAVGNALARQRRRQRQQGHHFRNFSADARGICRQPDQADRARTYVVDPSAYVAKASIDPFETLSVDARHLTTLFHAKSSLCAGEPVFSVNDAVHFQTLPSVFNTDLTDGALAAAVGFTMSYFANGRKLDHKCAQFGTVALREIRKKLADPDSADLPAIIGSILLMIGIDYREGQREQAQTHLNGVQALLQLCSKRGITLSLALRRSIYWQDLFSAIFVRTDRIVHHGDFHPGEHAPTLPLHTAHHVPRGFASRVPRLGQEFINIVSDVGALYYDREKWLQQGTQEGLETLCNTQAQLEDRLHELRQNTSDELTTACIIAAFLCTYGFWTSVWGGALIPRGLSKQLLQHMQGWQMTESEQDDGLLFWLVHVGKAFSIDEEIRHGLDKAQARCRLARIDLELDGSHAKEILYEFIWSDVFHNPENGWFWQRINEGV